MIADLLLEAGHRRYVVGKAFVNIGGGQDERVAATEGRHGQGYFGVLGDGSAGVEPDPTKFSDADGFLFLEKFVHE